MRPIPDTILTLTAAVLLLITAAVSCSGIRSGDVTAVLSAADSLMKTRPATALDTLRAIDSTALSGLSRKQTAYYRLLMTEAKYKCWMSVAKDTAVFETAEYYRKHGPESLYARALMISGTVLQESGRPVLALEAYKAAEPVMEAVGDYEQTGLLHTRIGELYQSTFVNTDHAIERYRQAIECFETGQVSHRLAPAYLSLARMLLADSTNNALPYIESGVRYAKDNKDTMWTAVGAELLSWYYLYSKEYAKAAKTAEKAIHTFDMHPLGKGPLVTAAAFSYIYLNKLDSARMLLPRLPLKDMADTVTYLEAKYLLVKAELHLEDALIIKDSLTTLGKELLKKGKDADFEKMEQYYNVMNEKQELESRNTKNILYLLAIVLGITVTGFIILTRYVAIISRQKRELAETSDLFIQISDKLLLTYRKYHQPDNFYRNISILINETFKGDEIKAKTRRLADILYPGFLEHIQKKYNMLNDNDLLIIALEISGLSIKSMAVISGRSEGSLYTARNRLTQKAGSSVPFSEFVSAELSSFIN